MTQSSDAWQRVREIFEGALALPTERRASFLATACRHDARLREQVDQLLASHERAGTFLERPAVALLEPDAAPAALEGRRIGPYQLDLRIGTGGMGEVYRAHDTRLNRQVAIKVLPAHVAGDLDARARLEREARAVAALSDPHVCTLYDIGSESGIDFLVMEYLEGETLAARLQQGPLPVAQAILYATQIASGLDKAHRSGIVHRDLKPGNVMLTAGGVKLLDFGLAKPTAVAEATGAMRPASDLTTPGTILGTLHYMAPEQLEGRATDARTDVFAFGCVFYEMLAGRKAFDGRSSASVVTAIMSVEPTPVVELQPLAPPGADYVIARCLAKDPEERWQTARDLLAELRRIGAAAGKPAHAPIAGDARALRRSLATAVLVAAAVAAGFGIASLVARRPSSIAPVTWLSILPPPGGFDLSPDPTISPNGRFVAFKAEDSSHRTSIWLKALDSAALTSLPGTEGTDFTCAPFWSPDSRSLGFFAQGKLKRVEIGGGSPQVLAAAPEPRGGTWTGTGVIIFNADAHNLYRIPATGGPQPSLINDINQPAWLFPHALSDGKHFLFTSRNVNGQGQGVYVGSLDSPEVKRVSDAWSPAVSANGHLLFVRQGTIFAQPFDAAGLTLTGEPHPVADGVGLGYGTPLSFPFSASQTGMVTYWSGTKETRTQLTWFDRSGTRIATAGQPEHRLGVSLSDDGRHVALERSDALTSVVDLWLLDMANPDRPSRFSFDGRPSTPVFSPDGSRVLFMERGHGLVTKRITDGSQQAITHSVLSQWPTDWSPDGRHIAWIETTPDGWRLLTAPADGSGTSAVYRQGAFFLAQLQFSSDSRWVAYESDESGQREVYIDSYPESGNKIRVSRAGGDWPKWRRDGKELYYLAPDWKLMAVTVTVDERALKASPAVVLFEGPGVGSDSSRSQFAPNPDGSRFLFNARVEDRTPVGLTVLTNWPTSFTNR